MIDFQFINSKKIKIKNNIQWFKKIILSENKKMGEIVFIFCNDAYLLEKNIQFLQHNTLTDVITFDYSNKNQISGDIFISTERVRENAKIFNVSFLEELDRVMAHGLLHLLGYKDKQKKDAKIIREKEDFYLSIK